MKLLMFSVFDSVSRTYGAPFFSPHVGLASRMFGDELSSSTTSVMTLHPTDFDLFLVGEFDTETGQCVPQTPSLVQQGSNFV